MLAKRKTGSITDHTIATLFNSLTLCETHRGNNRQIQSVVVLLSFPLYDFTEMMNDDAGEDEDDE